MLKYRIQSIVLKYVGSKNLCFFYSANCKRNFPKYCPFCNTYTQRHIPYDGYSFIRPEQYKMYILSMNVYFFR